MIERPGAFVHGEFARGSGGHRAEIANPATGERVAEVALAGRDDAERAVASAAQAFTSWRRTTAAERSRLLATMADRLQQARPSFAALETENVGMPIAFAESTVDAAVDVLRFFAGAARVLEGRSAGEYVRAMTSFVRREPVGVVAQFVPWNVPLLMAIWKMAPALAAGNTVVLKPSVRTPLSVLELCRLLDVLPPGVVNVVVGDHEDLAPVLAADARVAMVAVTGSLPAGSSIGALAAPTAKRMHLELGGKTPVIVCDDADIDLAAATIVRAGLENAGQDCTAASRVLAVEAIHDRLEEALVARMARVRVGDPLDREMELGPVIALDRRSWLLGQIDEAIREGARPASGGRPIPGPGAFLEPTLLVDVPPGAAVTRTELFGPVITLERCRDESDALQRANETPYALAAGIWTASVTRALRLATEIDAGKVWVNEHHRDVTEMPHGGRRGSGHGSDLSVYALEEYTTLKAVHVALPELDA